MALLESASAPRTSIADAAATALEVPLRDFQRFSRKSIRVSASKSCAILRSSSLTD